MATIAATNSATPSVQYAMLQRRLETARRDADQAAAEVQNLSQQTDQASSTLRQKQDQVKTLSSQVSQSDPTYQARVQASQNTIPTKTQQRVTDLYNSAKNSTLMSSNLLNSFRTSASQTLGSGLLVNVSA